MEFRGPGQPLTRVGLMRVLDALGLGPGGAAYLWAVVEVETTGFGFWADRRPRILFERHIFRRQTGGRFDAEAPEISGNPGNYGLQSQQYPKLERAIALCEREGLAIDLALNSASWGLGQVMGFNHDAAGFGDARAMVEATISGEDAQLLIMAGFLAANNLVKPLRERDWETFARRYNGREYAKNRYHLKLEEAYDRFSTGSLPDIELRTAQAALLYLGYAPGKIDGVIGRRTRGALRSFRIAAGLPSGDDLDGPAYQELMRRAELAA